MRNTNGTKHIAVIGAGPGGLTAAMILARRGFRVSVFEARDHVGGRNAPLVRGPYTFDVGPTFLMLSEILGQVMHEAGADMNSMLDLRRLEPMYRLVFGEQSMEVSSDPAGMKAAIAALFPGLEDRYDVFRKQEQTRFRRLFPCLQKAYHRPGTLLSPDLLRALPHLSLGRSLFDVMKGCFRKDQLALAFTFQSKYLGMSPWDCPGLFAIIPYIEHAFGIYHPIGGLSRISDAMAEVATRNGAELHLDTPVERIVTRGRTACGVRLGGGDVIECDDVVINADFGTAATTLFEPGVLRKYTPRRLRRMKLSCSTFMLYLGVDKLYEDVPHHTICFARNYRANVQSVFAGAEVGSDMSFYLRNASVTDPTLAPPGESAVYILVPVGNLRGVVDWQQRTAGFRDVVYDMVEARTGMKDLRQHVREEIVLTPRDWADRYMVYEGATFNLAHNLGQMIYLRPRNKFEELDHCYLVGGGTHPGSGLPTIYESGRIAANLISRSYGIEFVSGNLEA